MSPIEKHLADLLEKSPDKLPLLLEDTSLTQKEMQLLASQDLIQKHDRPDGGWWVNPTDDGLLYFVRKKESRRTVLRKMLASFASGVISALLIEHHMGIFQSLVSLFRG